MLPGEEVIARAKRNDSANIENAPNSSSLGAVYIEGYFIKPPYSPCMVIPLLSGFFLESSTTRSWD